MGKANRVFIVEGKKYRANRKAIAKQFQVEFEKKKFYNPTLTKLEYRIEVGINSNSVSEKTVGNWLNGSAPGDIDTMKALAKFWNIDVMELLVEGGERKMPTELSDSQIMSVKRIYDSLIDYLDEFERTNGFDSMYFNDIDSTELDTFVNYKWLDVYKAYQKEKLFLADLDIYAAFYDFICNDLSEMTEDKVGIDRPVTSSEGTILSTEDEYDKAMSALNDLLDEYYYVFK